MSKTFFVCYEVEEEGKEGFQELRPEVVGGRTKRRNRQDPYPSGTDKGLVKVCIKMTGPGFQLNG